MADTTYINGSAALKSFIQGIHSRVDELLDERNINASGRLKRSITTTTRETFAATIGTMDALDYWKEGGGSGTPPGKWVEYGLLRKWAFDKGIANTPQEADRIASGSQINILQFGSRRFRLEERNVFEQAVEEAQSRIPDVLAAFLRDTDHRHRKQFIQSFSA